MESSIEYIKMETAKYLKEKDLKIDFLNKELKKNVNIEYIRNIIYMFITNTDLTVNIYYHVFFISDPINIGERKINSCDMYSPSIFTK